MAIEKTPEMLAVARRLVWFDEPEAALDHPYLFLVQVMTLGTTDDVLAVQDQLGMEPFRETLERAPGGSFDARSWCYWNLILDRWPPPPLPVRDL